MAIPIIVEMRGPKVRVCHWVGEQHGLSYILDRLQVCTLLDCLLVMVICRPSLFFWKLRLRIADGIISFANTVRGRQRCDSAWMLPEPAALAGRQLSYKYVEMLWCGCARPRKY
jgi:hypothetical protein